MIVTVTSKLDKANRWRKSISKINAKSKCPMHRVCSSYLPVWWIFSRLRELSAGSIRKVYWDGNALLFPPANLNSLPSNWYSALCLLYVSSFASNVSMSASITCWRSVLPIDTASDVLLPTFTCVGLMPLAASLWQRDREWNGVRHIYKRQDLNQYVMSMFCNTVAHPLCDHHNGPFL